MDELIEGSQFGNTYGKLDMILHEDGKPYLKMGDCFGNEYFGPLNKEQIAAFELLCQIPKAEI